MSKCFIKPQLNIVLWLPRVKLIIHPVARIWCNSVIHLQAWSLQMLLCQWELFQYKPVIQAQPQEYSLQVCLTSVLTYCILSTIYVERLNRLGRGKGGRGTTAEGMGGAQPQMLKAIFNLTWLSWQFNTKLMQKSSTAHGWLQTVYQLRQNRPLFGSAHVE